MKLGGVHFSVRSLFVHVWGAEFSIPKPMRMTGRRINLPCDLASRISRRDEKHALAFCSLVEISGGGGAEGGWGGGGGGGGVVACALLLSVKEEQGFDFFFGGEGEGERR